MTDLGGTSDAVAFEGEWTGPIVATSVHAGHGLRPEIAEAMVLDEAERFREEDPFTDRIAAVVPDRVITSRSRFEADLNRPRREAVYRSPEDCWGLDVWREGVLSDELFEGCLETYDAFYDALAPRLDALAERGPFVLLDVHSYNHRRDGADEPPAPPAENPEVNVGTGSVDDDLFGPLVERFMGDIRQASSGSGPLDARENVAFEGRNLAWWVHDRYPRVGCVLALEFKKTFMDEWSGELDEERLRAAQDALSATLPGLREELEAAVTDSSDGGLSADDLALDHRLALLSGSFRFLLDITPVDADDLRDDFLEGRDPAPDFTYRELETDPEVVRAELDSIELGAIEDPVLGQLLRAKHREMELQLDMLQARDTDDFLPLSVELYGGVSPSLRRQAEGLLESITTTEPSGAALDAEEFLALAEEEIARYRDEDPDLDMHAEIRPDVNGVMVSGDVLLIGPETKVQQARAAALLHHEVGTHLVTQANGSHQPIKVLGVGLAGYDETQEGLAVLAEIACGGLTAFRLRQLASRVVTVHRMIGGASFAEAHEALVDDDFPVASAYTTVMRVYRSGGMTKDAIYLRGLVELLEHLGADGSLDQLWLGKFSLRDLPLIGDLQDRGLLRPPRVLPRYLHDPATHANLARAVGTEDLSTLLEGHS